MTPFSTLILLILFSISAAGQTAADLVLINANIRTMDSRRPGAQAMAVTDGRIVGLGTNKDVARFVGSNSKVIDVGGKLVIPGFNDAHVHLAGIGNSFSHLDLRDVRSPVEMIARIRDASRFLPKGRWLMARGWNAATPLSLPSKKEIDDATPDNPLLLYSTDYRFAFVNSPALKLTGIVSANGIISGVELEKVRRSVPTDHEKNWPEIIEIASNYAASLGVTSVQDVHSDDLLEVLRDLDAKGKLKTRVYECVGLSDRKKSIAAGLKAASGNSMVRGGCVKGMSDGSGEEVAELNQQIAEADKGGLQVMIHAIGQNANINTLAAFDACIAANGTRDRRFRVEHGARARLTDSTRVARSGVVASMQPHLFYNGPVSGDDYKRIRDAGFTLAFGSDASITDLDPLLGIFAAVNSGSRSITVEEAVSAYTLGSAYAEFQDRDKGTLEIGKLADMAVLSDDIFTIAKKRIAETKVEMTIVNGKVVFDVKLPLL